MKKTTEEKKIQGIVENPEQFETPVAGTTAERPSADAAEPQEPSEQTDTPAEDKSKTKAPSKAKHFLTEAFRYLFSLAVLATLGYFIWTGVEKVYDRYHVESRKHLSEKLDLVRYGNTDYQLQWADKHRKFSERFDYRPDLWNDKQVVHYCLKDGGEVTVSLKTLKTVQSDRICRPDHRGVAACIDERLQVSFRNLHTGALAFETRFAVPNDYDDDDEFITQFEGAYCVFPTTDGECLIDTNGNVLLHGFFQIEFEGGRYIIATAGQKDDWTESLYDARDMKCLLTDKDEIKVTPIGIYYAEGEQRYLMDSTLTRLITNLVMDELDDEYESYEEHLPLESLCEPDDSDKDSGYKLFSSYYSYGVFDQNYHVVIPPKWDYIKYLGNGYFACQTEGFSVIVNRKGEILTRRE